MVCVYEPSFKILFPGRMWDVNRAVVDPQHAEDCAPVDGDVGVRKVAPQNHYAEEGVANVLECWRLNPLEEFDGSRDDERD